MYILGQRWNPWDHAQVGGGGGKREGGHEGDQEESIREKDCTGLVTSSRKTGTEASPPDLSDKCHKRPCQSNFSWLWGINNSVDWRERNKCRHLNFSKLCEQELLTYWYLIGEDTVHFILLVTLECSYLYYCHFWDKEVNKVRWETDTSKKWIEERGWWGWNKLKHSHTSRGRDHSRERVE